MGKAEKRVRTDQDRNSSEESHCSEADESRSTQEAVRTRESTLGESEEGWSQVFIEP